MTIKEIIEIVSKEKQVDGDEIFPFVIENRRDGEFRYRAVVAGYDPEQDYPCVFYAILLNDTGNIGTGHDAVASSDRFCLIDSLNERLDQFNTDIEEIVHDRDRANNKGNNKDVR